MGGTTDKIHIYGTGVCRFYCALDLIHTLRKMEPSIDVSLVSDLDRKAIGDKFRMRHIDVELIRPSDELKQAEGVHVKYYNRQPLGWGHAERNGNLQIMLDTNKAKFSALRTIADTDYQSLAHELGANDRFVMLAGSVKEQEVRDVIDWYLGFRNEVDKNCLIVAPRDERGIQIARKHLDDLFQEYSLRTNYTLNGKKDNEIIILDTMGELRHFYSIADVAFIGTSMDPDENGSNPLEAAFFGVPILFGPGMHLNKELADGLTQTGIAKTILSFDHLGEAVKNYMKHGLTEQVRASTKSYIQENQNGNDEYAEFILKTIYQELVTTQSYQKPAAPLPVAQVGYGQRQELHLLSHAFSSQQ